MVIRCLISAMDEIALTPSEARKEPEALFHVLVQPALLTNMRPMPGGRSVAGRWPVASGFCWWLVAGGAGEKE